MCNVLAVKRECAEAADILTAVGEASAAGVGDFVSAHGTFVAGDVDNLDKLGLTLSPPMAIFHTLAENCTFFVNTAAHGRYVLPGTMVFGISKDFQKRVIPCKPRDLAQDFIFKILYLSVEFFSLISPLEIADLDSLAHLLQAICRAP